MMSAWRRAQRVTTSTAIFLFVAVAAALVLLGWAFDVGVLKSVVPGLITMKANTAVGLIALAGAAALQARVDRSRRRLLAVTLPLLVCALAVLTMSEYLFNLDFHIDELLFADVEGRTGRWPPGRFAPVTCLNFAFVSSAILLRELSPQRSEKRVQGLVLIAWVISFQALVGYLSGVTYSFGSAFYTQIALHTAVLFVALSTGLLLLWRHEGYLQDLAGDEVAGRVGRKLLVSAILIPPLINSIQLKGLHLGLYDADFGVLLRVVGSVVFFSWMAFETGRYLSETDEKRSVAEQARAVLLAQAKERAVELEKALRARDELLGICSHELRTPIATMKLQTQLAKRNLEKGAAEGLSRERITKLVDQSDRQLDRLTRLIDEMLEFSRLDSGHFELSRDDFDLRAIATGLLARLKPELDWGGHQITLRAGGPLRVRWDRHRIEEVLTNLLTNAIKYGRGKPAELSLATEGGVAVMRMKDQGIGIPAQDLARIFEAYERAISVTSISGLGLGLFISKAIVKAHGGTIEVESTLGEGSVFTVRIPPDFPQPAQPVQAGVHAA